MPHGRPEEDACSGRETLIKILKPGLFACRQGTCRRPCGPDRSWPRPSIAFPSESRNVHAHLRSWSHCCRICGAIHSPDTRSRFAQIEQPGQIVDKRLAGDAAPSGSPSSDRPLQRPTRESATEFNRINVIAALEICATAGRGPAAPRGRY